MFNWKKGRQHTGYDILTIISFLFFDIHLIRYNAGNFIPKHIDAVDKHKHHRINIVLQQPKYSGIFICDKAKRYLFGRIIYFRPDIMEHSVTICNTQRLVLSIGWVT